MRRWLASITFLLVAVSGFEAQGSPLPPDEPDPVAARPYGLEVPEGYDGSHPVPLVVLLHSYRSSGSAQNAYFRLSDQADRATFLLAYPDGTRDLGGSRFWNATDGCCNYYGSTVDDVAYLDAVIDDVVHRYRVDPDRVYLVGHSNGGFMAHRYACSRPGRVAAIVTLAGMQWKDPRYCTAPSPVSVLHVHGHDDTSIEYDGGSTAQGRYPGAVETVATWAAKDGCTGELVAAGRHLDLDTTTFGEETSVARYRGCPGVDVELWTIGDGRHTPAFQSNWAPAIWDFMAAHPKP